MKKSTLINYSYFHLKNSRTGMIWEGRFKSCLVDSEHYLFALYKYIELNPIKAGMVKELADYKWSSYGHNALGQEDRLVSEHSLYKALGADSQQRNKNYQKIFDELDLTRQENLITEATLRGEVYGTAGFHEKVCPLVLRATRLGLMEETEKVKRIKGEAG